jgi:hypothetical protein
MSKTHKHEKPIGYTFWSRRCFGNVNISYGPVAKLITKQKERTRRKKIILKVLKDPNDYEGRFPGE